MYKYFACLLGFSLVLGCFTIENRYTGLAPGPWRATLDLNPITEGTLVEEVKNQKYNLDDTPKNHLPFTFEVTYINEEDFYITLINGEERIKVEEVVIGRNRATAKDSFLIEFPLYDSYIKGYYRERIMQGNWVVTSKINYSIPFVAKYGQNHRFTRLKQKTTLDVSGTWAVEFKDADGTFPGVGEFKQVGNELTGTFRTETGDYRYLEGTIQKDKLHLSVFDGSHAFLFEAKILADNSLIGTFRSGNHYEASWTAVKDDKATLADPNSLTFLKEGYDRLDFSFENADGRTISLSDADLQDKVVILQLFGTWCPNCRDETEFLVDYFQKNPFPEVVVLGLAFEQQKNLNKRKATLKRYKERLGINYELLMAGDADKKEAAKALPMLNHIMAYPTLIFLDKKGVVRKIHTGFSGPATSQYEAFQQEFDATLKELKSEN